MWNWGSPIAWSIFIVAVGLGSALVAVSFEVFSRAIHRFASLASIRRK